MVVADTSSVNYAILIGEIDVLHQLYDVIVLPEAVRAELLDPGAPERVRNWIAHPPSWLEIRSTPSGVEPQIHLGRGERDAICLAELLGATLLMDERDGRAEAKRRGLPSTGLLGALLDASERGLIDLPSALNKLQQTTFHLSPKVINRLLGKR